MILVVHQNNKVLKVLDAKKQSIANMQIGQSVTKILLQIANIYPDTLIVWCDSIYEQELDIEILPIIFHHKRILASYNPSMLEYLPKQIGFIERSYYLKIKKEVTYPTWQTSSLVGGIYTDVLRNLKGELNSKDNFDYFLNSLGKRAMIEGLFCYSEPKLLKNYKVVKTEIKQATTYELFKFVKQHYKWVWGCILSLCFVIYEKKISSIWSFLKSLFYFQRNTNFKLENIVIQTSRKVVNNKNVDVIIPTIGRKKYLYDVLKDLSVQTILPKNVIIVEQNSNKDSVTELDYLTTETWPFIIKHQFTHQAGVCNARNLALTKVESEWVLLGDDDNRFDADLIEKLFKGIEQYGVNVATTVYLQPSERQVYLKSAQTTIFGAGNTILKSNLLTSVAFNTRYEFNYGEDTEFGMQLRYLGQDVVYFSDIKITHLKAPIGGYRTKVKQLWDSDAIQPKPSPTIMLLNMTYFTEQQLKGYKLLLFIKNYSSQSIKNPFKYIKYAKKRWNKSMYWSTILKQQQNA